MIKIIITIVLSLFAVKSEAAILGERSVLVFMIKNSPVAAIPSTEDSQYAVDLANYYLWTASGHQAWLKADILPAIVANYSGCNLGVILTVAGNAARAAGIVTNQYDHIVYTWTPDPACTFVAFTGGKTSFFNGSFSSFSPHEFGHAYGFNHSLGYVNGAFWGEHAFCMMRASNGYGGYNVALQHKAGWSNSLNPIVTVTSSSSYQLSDLDNPSLDGKPKGLRIVKSSTETLWVESRYGLVQVLLQVGSNIGMIDMSPWTLGNWHDGSLIRGWGYFDPDQPILIWFDHSGIVHVIWY